MTGEQADLFKLTNRSSRTCTLDGYPGVSLSHLSKRLAFIYLDGGGPYVTKQKPQRVTLAPGQHGSFLVAKYRCDGGVLSAATSIRIVLPATPSGSVILGLGGLTAGALDYCKRYPGDQPVDPGNRVTVSPVEPSLLATRSQA
jgi:hypothetical protein